MDALVVPGFEALALFSFRGCACVFAEMFTSLALAAGLSFSSLHACKFKVGQMVHLLQTINARWSSYIAGLHLALVLWEERSY
jgi:hypothetical protein